MNPSRTRLPDTLVHHVARELLQRAQMIKLPLLRVREISPAPLPVAELKHLYPKMQIEQWRMAEAKPAQNLWQKLNPFGQIQTHTWDAFAPTADAQLVIAPFVLDGLYAQDVLTRLDQLPQWFAPDGVLLFAMLGAGALPELVNRDTDWLAHLKHLPNIMDTGARLQALRFGLPVLDVETVRLGYSDAETLWGDVLNLSPSLRALDASEQPQWRDKIHTEFAQGLRELSLEIIFGQVWQPSAPVQDDGVRTVSLESLTNSLKSNRMN
ncbi:MAG: hypothetical protein H6R05_54 [Burkholderiaceae bacterium]|nr:hypothetical protein [Burkholderiaceae bacterium]